MIRCDVSEHENIRGHTACYLVSNLHQTETDVVLQVFSIRCFTLVISEGVNEEEEFQLL